MAAAAAVTGATLGLFSYFNKEKTTQFFVAMAGFSKWVLGHSEFQESERKYVISLLDAVDIRSESAVDSILVDSNIGAVLRLNGTFTQSENYTSGGLLRTWQK